MRFSIILISFYLCLPAWAEVPAAGEQVADTPQRATGEIDAIKKTSANLTPEMKEKAKLLFSNATDFLRDKEYEAAVIRLKQLLDIDPASSAGHYYLAEAYFNLNDLKNAALHYHDAITFGPDSQEAVLAQVRLSKIEKSAAPATPASAVPAAAP